MKSIEATARMMDLIKKGLQDIGYQPGLMREHYPFSDPGTPAHPVRHIDLAAFAQEPLSVRNACLGVAVVSGKAPKDLQPFRALGAPQVFGLDADRGLVTRWKMPASGLPEYLDEFPWDQFPTVVWERRQVWGPQEVLRAKSISFTRRPVQLDFFDVGFMPALEDMINDKLDALLKEVIAASKQAYLARHGREPDYEELFRLIFRLIAAKLLADRGHPGGWEQMDAPTAVEAVEARYFADVPREPVLSDPEVQQVAWASFRQGVHFQNLSVETLAYVFENTLVSETTRATYDTHATPPGIAEFVVQHLPFERIDLERCHIFEPFSGHAPFLIAALSRLRTLVPELDPTERHRYFVRSLSGMEADPFAREAAFNSLIIADYPNLDSWDIALGDAFSSPTFDRYLERARVVLCNPPFGEFTEEQRTANPVLGSGSKAVAALERVLANPPAMLGFVLPRAFAEGQSYREARRRINALYDDVYLVELPENAFRYSGFPTVLLICHGRRTDHPHRRAALVVKKDYEAFLETAEPTWKSEAPSIWVPADDATLWYPALQRVWEGIQMLETLGDMAEVHRGIEYNIPFARHVSALMADRPTPGFQPGIQRVTPDFEPLREPPTVYLNMDPVLMRRQAHELPWDQPKVIANAVRLSRGPWTLAAALDAQGRVCYQNFHGIWSKGGLPLEVIAALLNGPVANAFIQTHRTSWHNLLTLVRSVPVPDFTEKQIEVITALVREFRSVREEAAIHAGLLAESQSHLFSGSDARCWELLWRIDAAVLAAYALESELEAELLHHFQGSARPGPFGERRPYPDGFPEFFLTEEAHAERLHRRRLRRRQQLVDAKYLRGLNEEEQQELARLTRETEAYFAPYYAPIIERLEEGLRQREGA